MNPLATIDDYTLLIGPVTTEDEARLDYLLLVASSVVVGAAPGLLPWTTYDDTADPPQTDPGAVPGPAVLVTCQTTAILMANPTGVTGRVIMERVGLAESQYQPGKNDYGEGVLPVGWKPLLKPWRAPELAAVRLAVPHPTMYRGGYGGDWWLHELEQPLVHDVVDVE